MRSQPDPYALRKKPKNAKIYRCFYAKMNQRRPAAKPDKQPIEGLDTVDRKETVESLPKNYRKVTNRLLEHYRFVPVITPQKYLNNLKKRVKYKGEVSPKNHESIYKLLVSAQETLLQELAPLLDKYPDVKEFLFVSGAYGRIKNLEPNTILEWLELSKAKRIASVNKWISERQWERKVNLIGFASEKLDNRFDEKKTNIEDLKTVYGLSTQEIEEGQNEQENKLVELGSKMLRNAAKTLGIDIDLNLDKPKEFRKNLYKLRKELIKRVNGITQKKPHLRRVFLHIGLDYTAGNSIRTEASVLENLVKEKQNPGHLEKKYQYLVYEAKILTPYRKGEPTNDTVFDFNFDPSVKEKRTTKSKRPSAKPKVTPKNPEAEATANDKITLIKFNYKERRADISPEDMAVAKWNREHNTEEQFRKDMKDLGIDKKLDWKDPKSIVTCALSMQHKVHIRDDYLLRDGKWGPISKAAKVELLAARKRGVVIEEVEMGLARARPRSKPPAGSAVAEARARNTAANRRPAEKESREKRRSIERFDRKRVAFMGDSFASGAILAGLGKLIPKVNRFTKHSTGLSYYIREAQREGSQVRKLIKNNDAVVYNIGRLDLNQRRSATEIKNRLDRLAKITKSINPNAKVVFIDFRPDKLKKPQDITKPLTGWAKRKDETRKNVNKYIRNGGNGLFQGFAYTHLVEDPRNTAFYRPELNRKDKPGKRIDQHYNKKGFEIMAKAFARQCLERDTKVERFIS